MPMVRCTECCVRQYAATPYVTVPECVGCGRPLLPPRFTRETERPLAGRRRAERSVAETRA
jgi:hypothetical protein